MEYNLDSFHRGLEELGIELSIEQEKQFITYYEMLVEKNKVMNLTAITEFEEVISKHFLDSLALVKSTVELDAMRVLDLGTGAGFPGIPLKIAFPQLQFTLMDSLNKRINFLNEVIDALGLEGVEAVHGRAEEMARNKKYRESYDMVVSRAVANISTLSEYCLPFVKIGGNFVSYKSGQIEEELNEGKSGIKKLGGQIKTVEQFRLPDSEYDRSLVVIAKEKATPKAYPRKAGTPSKDPLK